MNIAYALHFYAGTHKQSLRDKAKNALGRGFAIVVSEYGTTDASGDGFVDQVETTRWFEWKDENSGNFIRNEMREKNLRFK